MRSPLGDPVRSESVAGMDMLNDMFQRQARRLETQLYQRAQDQRTIEMTQRQANVARAQVRQLEQHHLEQAARISQGSKSLQRLQDLIRESVLCNHHALSVCAALETDVAALREALAREAPSALASLQLQCEEGRQSEALRGRAHALERAITETERSALQQIGATPLQTVAMSSDCNPLNDLSAVADYASKASVGAAAASRADVPAAAAPSANGYAMPSAAYAPAGAPPLPPSCGVSCSAASYHAQAPPAMAPPAMAPRAMAPPPQVATPPSHHPMAALSGLAEFASAREAAVDSPHVPMSISRSASFDVLPARSS